MPAILIAEDEGLITDFLEKGLRANGFATEVATDAEQALRRARSGRFALVILDLGLPDADGIEVLRQLRAEGSALPVVILTGRHSVQDKVLLLEGGADDYVTKPFRFDELLARIRLRLREDEGAEPGVLEVADMTLDVRTREVTIGVRSARLSPREFALAQVFFRRPGQILTRQQLLHEVWGSDLLPGSNILDVYIGYLRRKLGPERITSVRRVGYRLEADAPSPPNAGGGEAQPGRPFGVSH